MKTVRSEIEKLLAELREKALTLDDMRATVEVSAIARQAHIPEVEPQLITPYARASVLGAWIQYDIRHLQ